MTASCVVCAREAEHGYLCVGCFTRLASMLRDIEDQAAMLDARPSMALRTGSGGGSLAAHRSPANLDVIVAADARRGQMRWGSDDFDEWGLDDTASVLETLHSWARMVREEQSAENTAEEDPAPTEPVTVSGERDLLTRELRWIARQPWVDDCFKDLRSLLSQLRRTNKTQEDRPEGTCFLPRYESTCGGTIWRREQQRVVDSTIGRRVVKVADGPAYCDRCRATWDGVDLSRLALILEQQRTEAARPKTEDGRRMLTAQEMADRLGVKLGNLRVIAHRLGAVAVNGHYDPEQFAERKASA